MDSPGPSPAPPAHAAEPLASLLMVLGPGVELQHTLQSYTINAVCISTPYMDSPSRSSEPHRLPLRKEKLSHSWGISLILPSHMEGSVWNWGGGEMALQAKTSTQES